MQELIYAFLVYFFFKCAKMRSHDCITERSKQCYNRIMKRYLADLLTLTRFILSIVLLALAFTGADIGMGLVIFLLGELTDAFDGTCAARWPFPKNKTPKYRKYAAKYDMVTDTLLATAMVFFFTLKVNLVAGLIMSISYIIFAIVVDLVVYGKLFGHPDDAKPGSLMHRNFLLAKKLILVRRNIYLAIMFTASVWTLFASEWPIATKIVITVIGCSVSLFLWFFLSQRRHHISRDAVSIENSLEETTGNLHETSQMTPSKKVSRAGMVKSK